MKSYESINDLDLQSIEQAVLLKGVWNAKTERVLKLYIPKIMSLGNAGLRNYSININRKLILNDSSTFPSVPTRVSARNYLEVPLVDSAFRGPYRECGCSPVLPIHLYKGEKVTCVIPNKNIKQIKATDWRV